MINKSMPDTSPLLQKSHEDYMRSLRIFSEAVKKLQPVRLEGMELIQKISEDEFFKEAKQYALSAQYKYYDSVVQWNKSINPTIQDLLDYTLQPLNTTQ